MALEPLDYTAYSKILDLAEVRKSLRPGLTVEAALQGLAQEQPWRTEFAQAYQRYTRRQSTRPAVTKAAPVRKAEASATSAFDEIRVQGDALFRTGQAGSPWEGMGMVAAAQPALYTAYVAERRAAAHLPETSLTKAADAGLAARPALPTPVASPPPRTAAHCQEHPQPSPSATDTLMAEIAKRQAAEPGLSFVAALDAVRKEAPELYDAYQAERRYPPLCGQPLTKQADPAPPDVRGDCGHGGRPGCQGGGPLASRCVDRLGARVSRRAGLLRGVQEILSGDGLQEHRAAHVAKRQARS